MVKPTKILVLSAATVGSGYLAMKLYFHWRLQHLPVPEHYDHVEHPKQLPPRNKDSLFPVASGNGVNAKSVNGKLQG